MVHAVCIQNLVQFDLSHDVIHCRFTKEEFLQLDLCQPILASSLLMLNIDIGATSLSESHLEEFL